MCLVGENSHCSMWWKQSPESEYYLGRIGHFFAKDAVCSKILLDKACEFLKNKGCTAVIGPINGNTWKSYRFVTWTDGSAPFLMEPQNSIHWPQFWQQAGFSPYQEYISSITNTLEESDSRLPRTRERLQNAGIIWRSLEKAKFEEELLHVFHLSREVFKKNILYSPIDKKSFLKLYLPYSDIVDTDYVMIAEDQEHNCCGFIFAIPDLMQLQRGEKINRLILKTLAVKSLRSSAGLGSVLVEEVQKKALHNGLTSAIHALMHCKNSSANIGKNSQVIRRYTLFIRTL